MFGVILFGIVVIDKLVEGFNKVVDGLSKFAGKIKDYFGSVYDGIILFFTNF